FRDKIHTVANPTAANDGGPRRHLNATHHVGDLSNSRGVECLQKRHLAHQIPGLYEIAPAIFRGKTGGQNASPQSESSNTADHDKGPEQVTERGLRYLVAVTRSGQRFHGPP